MAVLAEVSRDEAPAYCRVRILVALVVILAAHLLLLNQRIHEVGSSHCLFPALKEALYIVRSPPASRLAVMLGNRLPDLAAIQG